MKYQIILLLLAIWSISLEAQDTLNQKRERLDFAKNYFEIGGSFQPSFTGKYLKNGTVTDYENSAGVVQYLNWGGFHFWGHGEFFITFPLNYLAFKKNEETSSQLLHSVVTGARFYPWRYKEKRITPYGGVNWSAVDFKQVVTPEDHHPSLSKDFMVGLDAGVLYGYKNFSLRLGASYLPNTSWEYPISKTQKATVKTPDFSIQLGLMYSMDMTKSTEEANIEKWNDYPTVSKHALGKSSFGNFFIGAGPSISFSLKKSAYNQSELPYLNERLASSNYFDIAAGYTFNKAGMFTSISFRNPKFETEGFGMTQTIKKTSVLLEVNKFLIDYSGFTPYLGINLAYDRIKYSEVDEDTSRALNFQEFEPGVTLGWDILPGKSQEALILRTNLRWYPLSSFEVDGFKFDFSQLEYNLIQVVFYPERLKKKVM